MKKLILLILIFICCSAFADSTIKIIHINDSHSHMDSEEITLDDAGNKATVHVGGMKYAATLLKSLKADNPGALVLHAGDATVGTPYFTLFKGQADADVLNGIGFDALTLGNHEFDRGNANLADFLRRLNFPVLSANISVPSGNVLYDRFRPYITKIVNGQMVGIIGLTPVKKTRLSSSPDADTTFSDETASLQKYVDELKAKGIRKIIVLSHYGYENDLAMAGRVTDIDVIIDGDTHTLLGDFASIGLPSAGPYPTVVRNADGDKVCVAQAWEYGRVVGELDVSFNGDKVAGCAGTPHLVVASDQGDAMPLHRSDISAVPADTGTLLILKKYDDLTAQMKQTVIGRAATVMIHTRIPGLRNTSQNGSEIAPVVAEAMYASDANADLALQNAGGVRIDIPAGDITVDEAYTLLPFANTICEIQVTGAELKQVMEDALEYIKVRGSAGAFPYAFAIKYDIDTTKPYGQRISGLEVKDRATGVWQNIDMKRTYLVATNSLLVTGKDGYKTFREVQASGRQAYNTGIDYADAFMDFVRGLAASGKPLTKVMSSDYPIKSFR